MSFLSLGSLWRSSGERDEEVLVPRNFGYVMILAPFKQTRMDGLVEGVERSREFLLLVLSGPTYSLSQQIWMAMKAKALRVEGTVFSCRSADSLGRLGKEA